MFSDSRGTISLRQPTIFKARFIENMTRFAVVGVAEADLRRDGSLSHVRDVIDSFPHGRDRSM